MLGSNCLYWGSNCLSLSVSRNKESIEVDEDTDDRPRSYANYEFEEELLDSEEEKWNPHDVMGVAALSLGGFALGVSEFLIPGIMLDIQKTFDVDIETAAWVTTSFMIGLTISTPVTTVIASDMPPKHFLILLLLALTVSAVLTATTQSFEELIAARVLSSFVFGAYMVAASYASIQLEPEDSRASGSAYFFTGLVISIAGGVPAGALLAQHTDWRTPYWCVTALAALALIGVVCLVPQDMKAADQTSKRQQLRVICESKVLLAYAATVLGSIGILAPHTYFAPMMLNSARFGEKDITLLTAVYGAGAAMGNYVGGKMAGINLLLTIRGLLLSLAVVLVASNWATYYKGPAVIALFLNAFTGFALGAPLMQYIASKAEKEQATMASALGISAVGFGIGIGVFLSGKAIELGYGAASPNIVGASATGLSLFFIEANERTCGSRRNHEGVHREDLLGCYHGENDSERTASGDGERLSLEGLTDRERISTRAS